MELSNCLADGKIFPPGFRFHPTDQELIVYYLKRKICRRRLGTDLIGVTDVYKWDPQDLPGLSKLKNSERQWYFFSPRDRKYSNGARSNRATRHGYWKTTGRDRVITCNSRSVGSKKTLVFHQGRAPAGQRTDWVMHEYTLNQEELQRCHTVHDSFVLYKVYKKSGLGSRNGEQYGTPFREEDWLDHNIDEAAHNDAESCTAHNDAESSTALNKFDNMSSMDHNSASDQRDLLLDNGDIGNLMYDALDHPIVDEQKIIVPLVDKFTTDIDLPVENQSNHHVAQKDFLGNLLEMNYMEELGIPNFFNEEIDDLCSKDFYNNADMYIQDMRPDMFNSLAYNVDHEQTQQQASQPCLNLHLNNQVGVPVMNLDNELTDIDSYLYLYDNVDTETDNQLICDSISNPTDTTFDGQMLMHNENLSIVAPAASLPVSGVMYDGNLANQNENHNVTTGQNVVGGDYWFSSDLWNFVESIPSSPALAVENVRAFEQMSSFGYMGINSVNKNVTGRSNSNGSSIRT